MEPGRIYCIDDDEDILLLYSLVLQQAGHQVTMISDGEAAIKAIEEHQPDLIILDEKMSGYSGMEICAIIRTNEKLPYIPIIMVTGVDSKEGKIKSLEEGIDDYMLKPFDHEELIAKVLVMLRIKRLHLDLLQTRQDLVKAEKLAAVGQLAAATAHEVRNPLSIIGASVQFLKSKMENDDEGTQVMDTILRKISEIDGTIRELLAAARPLKLKKKPMDINQCVREVVGFIKEKCLVQKIELELVLNADLPEILGDEEYLQRVFLNIFINALNSMGQGGFLRVFSEKEGDNRICIRIEDTGKGIPPEDIEHLFEPFFTRHPGGSGLGLFVVKMIVDELKGDIRVSSQPGQGTVFYVAFPIENNEKMLKSDPVIPDNSTIGEGSG
ncbi:response regulator [bacterium]|nr:response regulator [bacterium]